MAAENISQPTPDEKRIVLLMADGKTVGEISRIMKKNKRTLEGTVDRMRYKFGVDKAQELIALFLRNNIIK